jgi:hypothetical protein
MNLVIQLGHRLFSRLSNMWNPQQPYAVHPGSQNRINAVFRSKNQFFKILTMPFSDEKFGDFVARLLDFDSINPVSLPWLYRQIAPHRNNARAYSDL